MFVAVENRSQIFACASCSSLVSSVTPVLEILDGRPEIERIEASGSERSPVLSPVMHTGEERERSGTFKNQPDGIGRELVTY